MGYNINMDESRQKIYEIVIGDADYFACDDDGFILIFDTIDEIMDYCHEHNISLDDITYYEDYVLEDEDLND